MKKYINENPAFGDIGPHEAESKEALADEMEEQFEMWANESIMQHYDIYENYGRPGLKHEIMRELRETFIAGLTEVK